MENEYVQIFRRNLPFIVRDDVTVRTILSDDTNKVFEKRLNDNTLIGLSVIHKNTIYLLCVDQAYRKQGIGSELLLKSEEYIKEQGYDIVKVGVGENYLMPGIPTSKMPYPENLCEDRIYPNVETTASDFMEKRGYSYGERRNNIFDMRAELDTIELPQLHIGDNMVY